MALLRSSLGAGFLGPRETRQWDDMLIDDDSLPSADVGSGDADANRGKTAALKCAKLRDRLLSLPLEGKAQSLRHVAPNLIGKDEPLSTFAAVIVDGAPLREETRHLLQSHYMLASVARGVMQILVMATVQPPEHQAELHVETTKRLFRDLQIYVCNTAVCELDEDAMPTVAFLLYAWIIPIAARTQNIPVFSACVNLLRICASLSRDEPALPVPPRCYGWCASHFAAKARGAALDMFGPMPHLPALDDIEMYAQAMAPELREMKREADAAPSILPLSKVVQPRTGFRLDRRLHAFLGSLQRAPLPFPPFETRAIGDTSEANLEFDVAGKRAVHEISSGRPENIPLRMLPACAARSLWYMTPKNLGGGWEHGDGVWHNDDRYHMATFLQDAGEFPIEEMDRFFRDRLSLEGSTGDANRRTRHALHHAQSHRGKIEAKRQRGDPPYVTPTCRTMGKVESMSDRRTFRCPFVADDTAASNDLRLTLMWQGHSEAATAEILKVRNRQGAQHACLAAYERASGRTRRRPFTYPHHYTYFAAFAEKAQSEVSSAPSSRLSPPGKADTPKTQ